MTVLGPSGAADHAPGPEVPYHLAGRRLSSAVVVELATADRLEGIPAAVHPSGNIQLRVPVGVAGGEV
jgi:hypothetical protein